MDVLTSYIVREILKGAFVALVLLLTLFNLFTFSDELKDLGGGYGLKEIFYFITLTSPRVFYELVPAAALLGSLFVLGAMANNRELIAMQAAGLSVFGIIKSTLLAGGVLAVISIVVGEFVAPACERMAQMVRVSARHEQVLMNAKYGLWLREDKKFINVRKIEDDGSLADLSIYELDGQQHLHLALYAERAVFLGKQEWRMKNVKTSEISTQQVQANFKEDLLWKSTIAPNLLKIVVVNPNNLSLYDLASYVGFLKKNHQKSHVFELAFWGRIVNPLVTFVMLLLSVPFVIGVRRGISVGGKMMVGVVIGMGFNILDKIVGHLGLIYDLNPPLMAFIPSLVALGLALFALRRVQR
ncbi:MAG: LPS export ABC transporter permease LptG [Methylococcales bacterium]|nr:LPS export ABC transporter permease LptG [Methylococcales bacterium]